MPSRFAVFAAALAILAACTDHAPAPTGFDLSASRSGLPFTVGLASPAWQARAAALVTQAGFNPQTATHAYPLLGVAQYVAVQRAEAADGGTDAEDLASGIGIGRGGRNRLQMDRGAGAGAAAGGAPVVPDLGEPVPAGATAGVWVCGVRDGARRNPPALRQPHGRPDRDRHLLGAEHRYADHGRVLDPGWHRRHQCARPI